MLAKQAAREQGAREAWFVDRDGNVTEGSSSNAWIVTADGKVVTRAADTAILRGITRDVLIGAIAAQGLSFEERPFTVAEALAAREAFLTSASQIVMPIVRIDGKPVGDGKPGPVARALRQAFHGHAAMGLETPDFRAKFACFPPTCACAAPRRCPVIPGSRPP